MRLNPSEKAEIINLVERSDLSVNRNLQQLGINKSTFYNWYHLFEQNGIEGLHPLLSSTRQRWNSIPQEQRNLVVEVALEYPELSPREKSGAICELLCAVSNCLGGMLVSLRLHDKQWSKRTYKRCINYTQGDLY